MKPAKKTVLVIMVCLAMVIPFGQISYVSSDTSILQEKSLNYINNVLPFDMNRYTVVFRSEYSLPSGPNDPTRWESVTYDLKSNSSTIHVVFVFMNGVLKQCGIDPLSGSPISDHSYTNMVQVAARVLGRLGECIGIDSSNLVNMLSLVDENKLGASGVAPYETMNVTRGDIVLSVSKMAIPTTFPPTTNASNSINSTAFTWTISHNGIVFNHFSLTFDNGVLGNIDDDRAAYPIGGTEVNISKEQAIDNAKQYIINWTSKFNITVTKETANLGSYPRNYTALYPFWNVLLEFSGNVVFVNAYVWADDGQVFWCYQGGSPLNMSELKLKPTPKPSQSPRNQQDNPASPSATPQPSNSNFDYSPTTPPINHQPNDDPTNSETNADQKDPIQQTEVIITVAGLAAFATAFLIFRKVKNNEKTSNDTK
jgi:hypothetical protein